LPIRNGLYADEQYVPAPINATNRSLGDFGLDAWQRKDGSGGLPSSELTIASVLKQKGFNTKLVGKWHLGQAKQEYWPLSHGFDEYVGSLSTHDHGGGDGKNARFPCTGKVPVILRLGCCARARLISTKIWCLSVSYS
jgi:hypothetical protein